MVTEDQKCLRQLCDALALARRNRDQASACGTVSEDELAHWDRQVEQATVALAQAVHDIAT